MISSPAPAPQPLHHHSHSREPLDARGEIEAGVVLLHRPLSLLLVPAEDAVDVCDGSARDIARVPRHLVRERSKTGRVGCGCHEDRRPRRRWTDANSLSNSHSRLSYWSYRKSAVREPPARRRRERCHEGSRWRPSPGSLAQPTTLVPRAGSTADRHCLG